MTHKQLIDSAYRWVLNNASCGIAFKELVTANNTGEIPDVIGFGSSGLSVLIECKASRSDFLCDKKKPFRRNPETGMGSHRFYCCPKGMIKVEELPESWGLIYVDEKGKAIAVHKPFKNNIDLYTNWQPKNEKGEYQMLYSALRRLQIRGLIKEIYNDPNAVTTEMPCEENPK